MIIEKEYKDYYTQVKYSAEDNVFHGKIEGIKDFVNFECDKADEVEEEFHKAVNDYLTFCEDIGKEPEKPLKSANTEKQSNK